MPSRRPAALFRHARRWLTPCATAAALACSMPAGATDYFWVNGSLSSLPGWGNGITLADTLLVDCPAALCGAKVVDQGFLNNGVTTMLDHLYFQYGNTFTNGWQTLLAGDVGLLDSYAGGRFVNESTGSLVKTGGTGVSSITISSTSRGGSIVDAMTGTIAFSGGAASFDSGAILLAASGAGINFNGGTASFADGVRLLGDGQFSIGVNSSIQGRIGAKNLAFTGGDLIGGTASTSAVLASNANWTGNGALQGRWLVESGHTLSAQGAGTRYIYGAVRNEGTVAVSDTHLYFLYGNTLDNAGRLELNGDVGLYNAYAGGALVNSGTVAKTAGDGVAWISGVSVQSNGGRFDAASGTLAMAGAGLNFNDGTRFTGAGVVHVASNATFAGRIDAQNLWLGDADFAGSNAELHGATRFTGGSLTGQWLLASDHVLTLDPGAAKYVYGSITNQGRIEQNDHLYFLYGQTLSNAGTLKLNGDVSLANAYAGGSLVNTGRLVKINGATGINGLGVTSSGLIDVQAGSIAFNSSNSTFEASAVLRAAAGTSLSFVGGSTTLADGVQLQGAGQFDFGGNSNFQGAIGAQHLSFSGGDLVGGTGAPGSHATLTSNAVWTGNGSLQGSWVLGSGHMLSVQGAGTRYIYGTVRNEGTLAVSDAHLYFLYGNTLDNAGRLELNGDVGLYNAYAGGVLINSGTVAKTAGSGVSAIAGLGVQSNGGRFDVASGTLELSGSLNFNDGTRFTGAGAVHVASSATFAGRIDAQNLWLGNADFAGSNAELHGATRLTGGSLTGQWLLASDHVLTLDPGAAKYVYGSITNRGRIEQNDHLYFLYGQTLSNAGTLHLNGDVSLANAYAGGVLINSGTLVKTSGTGESSLATLAVVNTGTLDVQQGVLRLPGSFLNQGRLVGQGSFAADLIVNAGNIGPAQAAPATLNLASSLQQQAEGTLSFGLFDAAHSDQLQVSGNLNLDGTLQLSCFTGCHFSAGSELLLIDGHGSLSGSFASIDFGSLPVGSFTLRYDTEHADVWLQATQDITAAVPEPRSYALLLAGLGVVGFMARRRQRG